MCVCVCGSSNVGHYRLSRRAAGVDVQCRCRYNCVWPCSRHAMSRYRQLRHSAVTLMTSATAAVAVTPDWASPCACMRVYKYTLHWLTMPTCAPCRQCYCGGSTGVCLSVCQWQLLLARGIRADSLCTVLQFMNELGASHMGRCARARCNSNYSMNVKYYKSRKNTQSHVKITQE